MKVSADVQRCVGNGLCEGIYPEVFVVNDDGIVEVGDTEADDIDAEHLAHAVESCPARALALR